MIRINLLPVRVSKKKEKGKNELYLFVALTLLALVFNWIWTDRQATELKTAETRLNRTKTEIAQLDKIIGEVRTIKADQAAVKEKLAVLDRLKAGRQGPVRVLSELAELTPKRLQIRKFDEKGGAVTIDGIAGSIDDVSLFLAALKKSQYFSVVELRKTSSKTEGKTKVVDFNLSATVNYTPTPTPVAEAGQAAKR